MMRPLVGFSKQHTFQSSTNLYFQNIVSRFLNPLTSRDRLSCLSVIFPTTRLFSTNETSALKLNDRLKPATSKIPLRTNRKLQRFYNNVTVKEFECKNEEHPTTNGSMWFIELDNRPLQTPGGKRFELPNETTAQLIASEWNVQSDHIEFELMPLTSLAIQTLDLVCYGDTRLQVEAETLKYLQTDVLLFRAPKDNPQTKILKEKQNQLLDPILHKIKEFYNLKKEFSVTESLNTPQQDKANLDTLASLLKQKSNWELSCLFSVVRHLKSYLLGISVLDGIICIEDAKNAATVEENYQREYWGKVEGHHDTEISTMEMWLNAAVQLQRSLNTGKL